MGKLNMDGVSVQATDGRVCGYFEGGVFKKRVDKFKHLFRSVNGYGIDAEAFDTFIKASAHTIRLIEKRDNACLEISVQDFDRLAIKNIPPFKNYGRQYYLPVKYWKITPINR